MSVRKKLWSFIFLISLFFGSMKTYADEPIDCDVQLDNCLIRVGVAYDNGYIDGRTFRIMEQACWEAYWDCYYW